MVRRSKPVATDPEEVVDDAVHGCKALQMGRRLDAAQLPLALAGRLIRHFNSIVRIRSCAVDDRRHHGAARGRGAAQLISDQPAGEPALFFRCFRHQVLVKRA